MTKSVCPYLFCESLNRASKVELTLLSTAWRRWVKSLNIQLQTVNRVIDGISNQISMEQLEIEKLQLEKDKRTYYMTNQWNGTQTWYPKPIFYKKYKSMIL